MGPVPVPMFSIKSQFSTFFCGLAFCFVYSYFRLSGLPDLNGKPEHQCMETKYQNQCPLPWTGLTNPHVPGPLTHLFSRLWAEPQYPREESPLAIFQAGLYPGHHDRALPAPCTGCEIRDP